MQKHTKRVLISLLLTVFTVVCFKTPGFAEHCVAGDHKDPGLMAADIVIARPVGAMATLTGLAIFVVSAPFSALGGNIPEAWTSLVISPAKYTFKRPLGHLDCE